MSNVVNINERVAYRFKFCELLKDFEIQNRGNRRYLIHTKTGEVVKKQQRDEITQCLLVLAKSISNLAD